MNRTILAKIRSAVTVRKSHPQNAFGAQDPIFGPVGATTAIIRLHPRGFAPPAFTGTHSPKAEGDLWAPRVPRKIPGWPSAMPTGAPRASRRRRGAAATVPPPRPRRAIASRSPWPEMSGREGSESPVEATIAIRVNPCTLPGGIGCSGDKSLERAARVQELGCRLESASILNACKSCPSTRE